MSSAGTADPLSASVLVLNRFYMAVHVVSVSRAFTLLFREPLPILRQAVSDERTQPRSCSAAQPRRRNELGEHCVQLREVQREKRGSHSARSPHAIDSPARLPEAQPDVEPEIRQSQVRELEVVLG